MTQGTTRCLLFLPVFLQNRHRLTVHAFCTDGKKRRIAVTIALLVLADTGLAMLVWWLVVGLVAGFLAGLVMRGSGFGVVGDIVAGIVGAIIGGWLFGLLGIHAGGGLIGTIIVAFVGACLLIGILRLLTRGSARSGL
jgi:uncharacterized membrane protein YeaQ/YmgE (transglycosylase-associated protein family)